MLASQLASSRSVTAVQLEGESNSKNKALTQQAAQLASIMVRMPSTLLLMTSLEGNCCLSGQEHTLNVNGFATPRKLVYQLNVNGYVLLLAGYP